MIYATLRVGSPPDRNSNFYDCQFFFCISETLLYSGYSTENKEGSNILRTLPWRTDRKKNRCSFYWPKWITPVLDASSNVFCDSVLPVSIVFNNKRHRIEVIVWSCRISDNLFQGQIKGQEELIQSRCSWLDLDCAQWPFGLCEINVRDGLASGSGGWCCSELRGWMRPRRLQRQSLQQVWSLTHFSLSFFPIELSSAS